jgi:predicted TIM-barrel fold metal-dependent hydrolase
MTTHNVISADSHVVEPGDLWLRYCDPDFRERAPRIVRYDGTDIYEADGGFRLFAVGSVANTGQDTRRRTGTFEETVPKGGYDLAARIVDMAVDGIDAEVIYPTFAMRLYAYDNSAYRAACFRAYNRWIADFVAPEPDRFKGVGMVSLHDPVEAAAQLREIRRLGLVSAMIALSTDRDVGYDSTFYDAFWATAEDLAMPIGLHLLTERRRTDIENVAAADTILLAVDIQRSLAEMIFGGVFTRFPRLMIVSVENDAGWAPYFVERLDRTFIRQQADPARAQPGARPPSEVFRRNVRMTFIHDRSSVCGRAISGIETLMWSSDYPHTASTWPKSREVLDFLLEGISETERHQIVAGNAAKLYGF